MATAPYQLWMDIAPIASAIRVSSTVTITTTTSHGLTTGAEIQVGDATGAAGTSMVGVYDVTVTSGTTFTYTAAGSAGTAVVGSAWIAYDLLNPPINYASGTARQNAMVADINTMNLSANGDGSGSTMSFDILQETTPAVGPWFNLVPDNTRFRLVYKNTGTTPASDASDVYFLGILDSVTSQLNGSGQGTITTVQLGDANVVLDRVSVFGKAAATRFIRKATRASNKTTFTTSSDHAFVAGQAVKISGVLTTSSASFNGIFLVLGGADAPTARTFKVTNAGSSVDNATSVAATFSRDGKSNEFIVLTATGSQKFFIQSGDTVRIRYTAGLGVGFGDPATVRRLINNTYSGTDVIRVSDTVIKCRFARPYNNTWGTFASTGFVSSPQPTAADPTLQPGQVTVNIPGGTTETTAVTNLMGIVNQYKSTDYALQRVMSTTGTASIVGGTTFDNGQAIQFSSCSLRSALDTVIETYSGNDVKERRYYVDLAGKLNFKLVDAASKPTYATAPYSIIVTGAGNPNTTTAKATVAPYNLSVNWDHSTIKNAQFTLPGQQGALPFTTVLDYNDLVDADGNRNFPDRLNAPLFDEVVDFPAATTNQGAQVMRAAAAYFVERYKPMLSGSFTLRGAGTAAHNQYGFSAGYAQTGVSTFALVSRWEPGQWVEIEAAGLGLTGLYRVEQVDWSLEPGSYTQIITITFNRRNPSDLASLIANLKK
jgi:hypothetical protein